MVIVYRMLLNVITDNDLSGYGSICIYIESSKLESRYHYGNVRFTAYCGVSITFQK